MRKGSIGEGEYNAISLEQLLVNFCSSLVMSVIKHWHIASVHKGITSVEINLKYNDCKTMTVAL